MTVEEFEEAIFATDGIRILVRAPRGTEITAPYTYDRALDETRTIKDWQRIRIEPCLGDLEYEVYDGAFEPVHGRMKLKRLRESYNI